MTEPESPPPEEKMEEETFEGDPDALAEAADIRSLLKRVKEEPPPAPKVDVLRGVQRKLRVRSKGKFYRDGWSTREDNPRGTYLITAIVMLVLVVVAWFALAPSGFARLLP